MKKKIIIIAVAVVAVSAILIWKPWSKKESVYTFETVKVTRGNISTVVTATGTLEAITTVDVGTQVSGIINNIYVDFNDNVKKGDVLAVLDQTSLKEQLVQSQASYDQAQAQLVYNEATWKRLKVLFDKNLVAQADYDQALYNYENSKASVVNAQSAVNRAKVNLAYATIKSPIDGVVLNRAIEEGQTVAASFSTPTLFTIVNDITQMEVQASIDEADIGQVVEGQRVSFTVDAYPDLTFDGTVSQLRIEPVTTNNVVTYTVILNAPNPDKKLMPGMTASVTIYIQERDNALRLSAKATRFNPDADYLAKVAADKKKAAAGPGTAQAAAPAMPAGQPPQPPQAVAASSDNKTAVNLKTVWMKDNAGGIYPVQITTGIDNSTNLEVISGLNEGDEVVYTMDGGNTQAAAARQNDGPPGPFGM